MQIKKQLAYIDETGNSDLDISKAGVSSHFIITAIIVDDLNSTSFSQQIEELRKKHFDTGEIKSSSVANNHGRRMKILIDLQNINFHIYSVIVDKKMLISKGFSYKESFYKFLPNLVYTELYNTYPNLKITADNHGSNEFMNSLIEYVNAHHINGDLFTNFEFGFTDSKLATQVQLADFISGTISKCIELGVEEDQSKAFLAMLNEKILSIRNWPPENDEFILDTTKLKDNQKANYYISTLCLYLTTKFISENSNRRKPKIFDQVNFLRYLLYHYQYVDSNAYISTNSIISHLEDIGNRKIEVQYFRNKVIAELRDKNIIIASTTRGGYKIPSSIKDIYDFLNHDNSIIQPMVRRIKICREKILLHTKNEIDIIEHTAYDNIKKILDN